MPLLKDEELFKRIKMGDIKPVYLLYGQEAYFITACVDAIVKKTVAKGNESFNLNRFSGDKLSMNDVEDAVEALPIMLSAIECKKCVVIKDLDIDKLAKNDLEQLMEMVTNPNESTALIIYSTSIVYDMKKSSKLKKLSEQVQKTGAVCEFALKDKPALKRALCATAKKSGLQLEMPTAELIIDRCSQSYEVLLNELDKLISYVSGSNKTEITKLDIDECCIASIDSTSFDLAKAILNKRYERAFMLLDELFYQRVEALSILGALNMCFIDLYRAKTGMATGHSIDEVLTDFNYPKNRLFAVKNAFRDVSGMSIEAIRRGLNALVEADLKLKSSKMEDRIILEYMIGSMI